MKGILLHRMTSLILDTTKNEAYLALAENGIVASETIITDGKQLSKFLLPSIESILQARKPDFIAIGTGPGSFTGTRIGAMVAKTLAFAWNVPLIPFSSTLLPDLAAIAASTYETFAAGTAPPQIELVYISPSP
jgi:tRNA threonylcarbamoyl adenosine modification protein YeaZ